MRDRSKPPSMQDAQHAERGAAQAKRVLRAGGPLADGEDAGQRVELVGERERLPVRVSGQRIAGEARQVVLPDRRGDFVRARPPRARSSVP